MPVDTSFGLYWKSKVGYTFENLIRFPNVPTPFLDVSVDRPEILGLGISNNSLMDGKLLLSVDAVYQNYSDTDFFRAIYVDQWAIQCGRSTRRIAVAEFEPAMPTTRTPCGQSFPTPPVEFYRQAASTTFNTFRLNSP